MTRIEINFHLKQLQKDYKSVADRDLSFEEWMTAQVLAVTSQMAHVVSGLEAVNADLGEEYQDLVRICTALYKTDKDAIREMINESLGGDNFDKFKDHLGV